MKSTLDKFNFMTKALDMAAMKAEQRGGYLASIYKPIIEIIMEKQSVFLTGGAGYVGV